MKIKITAIPQEGQTILFDQHTPWFKALVAQFSQVYPKGAPAQGNIELYKTLQNISLNGELSLHLQTSCARCGKAFETDLIVEMVRNLVPYFSGPREALLSEEEEVELSAEDLEFSFYHGEEIDLGEIVAEEINLALPIRFLCNEECPGLCPRCGKNLNEGDCSCSNENPASPFSVLKKLKLKD